MLTIRDEQMTVFADYMLKAFEARMIDALSAILASRKETMTDEQILSAIHKGIAEAKLYEIEEEESVGRFLEFTFLRPGSIEKDRALTWAKEILADRFLSSFEKMDQIEEHLNRT